MPRQFAPRPPGAPRASALSAPATGTADEQTVATWLTALQALQGVPFNYLVPDAAMLPPESIRFFTVDPSWMIALLDGAFSIGSAGEGAGTPVGGTPAAQPMSGFLLRSAVVSGWPGMEVTAYADAGGAQTLSAVRLELVGPAVMLGLFSGTVARVDFREPSEALHFGVEAQSGPVTKELRWAGRGSGGGNVVGRYTGTSVTVPMRAGGRSVIQADALAQAMSTQVGMTDTPFTAAAFGLEMIEGVQMVTMQIGGDA